jgi:hypothetical protein
VSGVCFQKTEVRRQKTAGKYGISSGLSVLCFLFSVICLLTPDTYLRPAARKSGQIEDLILFDKIDKNDINDEFAKKRIHQVFSI